MHRRTVITGVAVALAGCADALEGPDAAEAEQLIREGINDARTAAGVGPLSVSDELTTLAQDHSTDMVERDFYDHVDPDGVGPHDRLPCRGSENIHSGELGRMKNVGGDETYHTRNTDELAGYVVEGWELSDEHRENMLDPAWTAIGVGVAIDDGEFFATAKFC